MAAMIENIHLTFSCGIFTNGIPLLPMAKIQKADLDINIRGWNKHWVIILGLNTDCSSSEFQLLA